MLLFGEEVNIGYCKPRFVLVTTIRQIHVVCMYLINVTQCPSFPKALKALSLDNYLYATMLLKKAPISLIFIIFIIYPADAVISHSPTGIVFRHFHCNIETEVSSFTLP